MELLVRGFESKNEIPVLLIKAYVVSLFFLAVVLSFAVGDAWTQYAEFYSMSPIRSKYTFHYLDFSRLAF